MKTIVSFEKGIEIGSNNYIEKNINDSIIHYLRVGDLISLSSTYIERSVVKNYAKEEDILIAFDGAPGRNNIGLEGSFSSGICKVVCDIKYKGFIYFELNSDLNQKIINDHSQGTTILHASKSIEHLKICECNDSHFNYFNQLFNRMVFLKKAISRLLKIKELLLNKYFTK